MAHPETGVQVTTGTPIGLLIENTDQRSKDYSEIKDKFRPGHADFTYEAKYGLRDYRGGGRSSARETATRVAAGAIARKVLPDVKVRGALVQMGPHKIDRANWDWDEIAEQSVLLSGQGQGRVLRDLSRRHPQERLLDRRRASRSSPRACRQAWAHRSTPSSIPTSPAR